ncbi:MAG: HDOD domain-containing protein [Thiobacillus sp.]
MSNDELSPAPIVGGGINTGSFEQPVVVTQMLGIGPAEPIREETLRARFLSFEPLFDSASRLAAYELVLRGRLAAAEGDDALAQMDEDMLLTGLYSLVQDGLTGELPLLVRVNPGVLFTDFPAQVNHPNLIWIVAVDSEAVFARMLALRDAGLRFCPILRGRDPHVLDSLDVWPHVMCSADLAPPAQAAASHFVIEGVAQAATLARWPEGTWFKGSLFTGETLTREEDQSLARRLDLLAVAMRQPLDTLINFFKLNPDMAQRLLDIANSPAGALSRPAVSAGHALVMMGRQRAQRVAILLALAGATPTDETRLYAKTAFARALFMGKVARMHTPAEDASVAFETGLLSTVALAFKRPVDDLVRKLGLPPAIAISLGDQALPQNVLLRLAHACESNDIDTLITLSRELGVSIDSLSAAYLDGVIAGESLETALA